jgi:hypothetical protein
VEWLGLLLVLALGLGALVALTPLVDGRSLGGFLAHRFVCAVRGGCSQLDGDAALARAYGPRVAGLVRSHAPGLVYEPGERQLPVDWRRCREPRCATAPDDRDLDVHRSAAGVPATVFTRVLRRGGRTYIQYWLYYPDSNSVVAGSDKAWETLWLLPRLRGIVAAAPGYPGYHRDDWESFQIRLEPDGGTWVRASSHGHYQGCKENECQGRWVGGSGWTRVSRGSHAGHIPFRTELRGPPVAGGWAGKTPGRAAPRLRRLPLYPGPDNRERTSTSEGLRLVPLETRAHGRYRRRDDGIAPPWRKDVYDHPESDGS